MKTSMEAIGANATLDISWPKTIGVVLIATNVKCPTAAVRNVASTRRVVIAANATTVIS